jgi:hypothetical protein
VKNNFTTLFDFEGALLINSAKRNESSFRRLPEGSTFAMNLLRLFSSTYDNTLDLMRYISPSIISDGRVIYDKYVKEDELLAESII